jgi:hypothetical protein
MPDLDRPFATADPMLPQPKIATEVILIISPIDDFINNSGWKFKLNDRKLSYKNTYLYQ